MLPHGAQLLKNPPAIWKTWVRSLSWEDPLEEGMTTHLSILAWRIPMDRVAWWDMTEQLSVSGNFTSLKVLLCADVPNVPVFSMWSGNKFSRLFQI